MDSMRSLNTSLPSSNSNPASSQPPEQLLQAFKTAALSVTNLYKTSVADQANARHLGYQEALEDLRAFLDREKLGTEDGETAKVRRWVVDRIDGTGTTTTTTTACDSDDENRDTPQGTTIRKESPETSQQPRQQSPTQSPPSTTTATTTVDESNSSSRPPTFTFTAGSQLPSSYPEDTDMQSEAGTLSSEPTQTPPTSNHTSPSVRLEVIPRGPRATHRPNGGIKHGPRSSTRESPGNAGSKRKFHFPDFFDISNFGNGRDGSGGGKRGRFT